MYNYLTTERVLTGKTDQPHSLKEEKTNSTNWQLQESLYSIFGLVCGQAKVYDDCMAVHPKIPMVQSSSSTLIVDPLIAC